MSEPGRPSHPAGAEPVEAPVTMEGHYALHRAYTIDFLALKALDAGTRERVAGEAVAWLEAASALHAGGTGIYSLLGGKGDLFVFHLRPDLESLAQAELDFAQLELNRYLTPTFSYVSVTELAMHTSAEQRIAGELRGRGIAPESEEWSLAMEARLEEEREIVAQRLKPRISQDRYVCFYPMSKRRGEQVNWYRLPARERGLMMRDHAMVGRKYAGRVLQLVTGSIGFDDWEWGVTLYAKDPVDFKKLIYEMRFDRASADYAEFGPFYLGIRIEAGHLPQLLTGQLVRG